ncbi:MAG: restriction endonuclease subunit S [Aquificaceae bacterium]|nr:restriction endonuclease subunit S [Aquificaceae bacterium]
MNNLWQLPEGWKWVKLGEVCKIHISSVYPYRNPEGKFYLYSILAYDSGSEPEVRYGKDIGSNKIKIKPEVCLFSKLNPDKPRVWIVKETYHDGESIASTEFLPLYPMQESISIDYLGVYLKSELFLSQILKYATGATSSRQRVSKNYIISALIPLPPLQEQKRIVQKIQEIFSRTKELKRSRRSKKRSGSPVEVRSLPHLPTPQLRAPRWLEVG